LVAGGGNLGGDGSGRRELPGHARAGISRDLPPGSPCPNRHRGGTPPQLPSLLLLFWSAIACANPPSKRGNREAAGPFSTTPRAHGMGDGRMDARSPSLSTTLMPNPPNLGHINQPCEAVSQSKNSRPSLQLVEWRRSRDDRGRVVLRLQPRGVVPGHVPACRPQQRPVRHLHPRDRRS